MKCRVIIIAFVMLLITGFLKAQNKVDPHKEKSDIKLFGNLYHQHHNFFDKAFSFQGLEAGVMTKRNLFLGLYGSCFVTNLKTEINHKVQFTWIGQSGVNVGYIFNVRTPDPMTIK